MPVLDLFHTMTLFLVLLSSFSTSRHPCPLSEFGQDMLGGTASQPEDQVLLSDTRALLQTRNPSQMCIYKHIQSRPHIHLHTTHIHTYPMHTLTCPHIYTYPSPGADTPVLPGCLHTASPSPCRHGPVPVLRGGTVLPSVPNDIRAQTTVRESADTPAHA